MCKTLPFSLNIRWGSRGGGGGGGGGADLRDGSINYPETNNVLYMHVYTCMTNLKRRYNLLRITSTFAQGRCSPHQYVCMHFSILDRFREKGPNAWFFKDFNLFDILEVLNVLSTLLLTH